MDWKKFCDNLKEILELEKYQRSFRYEINDEHILIEYIEYIELNKMKISYIYKKEQFIEDYKNNGNNNGIIVLNENYYEVPIVLKNEYDQITIRMDKIKYTDEENGLQYEIGKPSKQFFFKIIENKIKIGFSMFPRRIFLRELEREDKECKKEHEIFDLLTILYKEYVTLRITSKKVRKEEDFEKLEDAFIFNMNYNTDIGIRPTYDFENLHNRRINNKFRNGDMSEISTPKRIYKKELVEQYNMASIADDSFIQYLCYYHILEHFYESVYKDELIRIVKEQLTSPAFSIKKDKEIITLIDKIKSKIKKDRENFDGDELESLELVIKKYVNVDELYKKINDINDELANYYDKKGVSFSKGIPINFKDKDNIFKNIAKRIYFTRNALVHYKSNDLKSKCMRNI